jgi:hypothetical protein
MRSLVMRRHQHSPLALPLWGFPVFALLLVLWGGLAAASDLHPVRHGEGRLWRVERGDAPPSHLMGTMHVTDPRVRDLPAPIREAFEGSEQAAFELLFTPEERRIVAQGRAAPSGELLAKVVDRETYDKAVALAARYGIPAKAVDRMPPGALAVLFQTPPDEFRRRAEGDLFLDLWLIQWAYDLGMRVVALEKLEEQLALFDEAPSQDQAEILREVLAQLDEEPDALERLVGDYLDGNMTPAYQRVEAMAREGEDPDAVRFKQAFLDARNRIMVDRMIPLLQRGRAFVAVGALHMPGDEGILHLLEQRGYRVTRVY